MKINSLPRLALLNVLAAAGSAGLGYACLLLEAPGAALPVLWLPSGLCLALLLAGGPRLLPGVWLGLAAALFPLASSSWGAAAVLAAGEAGAFWLGAAVLRHILPGGGSDAAEAPTRLILVAYGCAVVAGLFSPMVLQLFGAVPAGGVDRAIVAWWLGDALGMVVFAPVLLALRDARAARTDFGCSPPMVALALATAAFGLLTFVAVRPLLANVYLQAALLLPPLMLVTMRCHPAVAYALNLALVSAAAVGAAGPFGQLLGDTASQRSYALHGFVLLSSVTVLFLAAHIRGVREMAKAARAGEQRFRRLTALTSDWYWEQDRDFRFTRMEGAAFGEAVELRARFIGKRREELPAFEPYNMSWEAHQQDLDEHRVFQGLILRHARGNGDAAYYSISGEPVYDEAGEFVGYRGVGRDVTPEIESREALLASERQFHDVADATFEGLFVHDYGRIVFANRACAELAGCSIEDLVGRQLLDFVAPEEHPRVIQHLASTEPVMNYETTGVHADGTRFPVEVFGRPFVFQGKPMRIAAIRDIGDRLRTEGALRAQIEFQRTLLDTMPNPVFYKDRQGRYLGYNRAFADFLGIGAEEFIGRTVLDLVPGEKGREMAANDEALFANPGIHSYEQVIETPRGRRYVMVYKDVFRDEKGDSAGFVGVLADITERKKTEQRLRRFQELSPAAIGIVSTAGEVIYMNPTAFALFGYRLEDVPNMEVWWQVAYPDPVYRADRYAAWIAAVEQTLAEGRYMFRFEGRVRCMDGRDRWIETMVSLGEDEIFMIFTDLTDYVAPPLPAR
ncbi:MAG: PAS domain S-box protein [Ignavibacteria bacterium]